MLFQGGIQTEVYQCLNIPGSSFCLVGRRHQRIIFGTVLKYTHQAITGKLASISSRITDSLNSHSYEATVDLHHLLSLQLIRQIR